MYTHRHICYFIVDCIVGRKDIQLWTKQSMRTKPFCLAVGKDWTLKPNKTDLREVHTDLSWTHKHRKADGVKAKKLENITQLLDAEQLGEDGPVRILIQGKVIVKTLHTRFLGLNFVSKNSAE